MARKLEHWNYVSNKMQKLIDAETFCDVTLVSEGKKFPVNRFLLSSCSDYFEALFTSSYKELVTEDIVINDVKADVLGKLIEFCFSGNVGIRSGNAENLLRGAHLLKMPTAITCFCEYYLKSLTTSNCLKSWLLAKELWLSEFEDKVLRYCLQNFRHISKLKYIELNLEQIEEIVSNLDIQTEIDVFDVVMNWVQHEPNIRMKHITALGSQVEFSIVKQSSFAKYIDILSDFEEVHDFLIDTMQFYSTSTSNKASICSPISLSSLGLEIYLRTFEEWKQIDRIDMGILDEQDILAAHIANNIIYIVCKRSGRRIEIKSYDLKKELPIYLIDTIPYESAAIAFAYPMVYLVGTDKTIFGLNLITLKDHTFPKSLMSVQRHHPGAIVLNDKLYVLGGENKIFSFFCPAIKHCSVVECFLLKSKTWISRPPMKYKVSEMGVAALNDKIYVVGGATSVSGSRRYVNEYTNIVQCYNPSSNTWSCLGNFVTECYGIKMCIWEGRILASGGTHRSITTLKKVYIYEAESDEWAEMASLKKISADLFTASTDFLIE